MLQWNAIDQMLLAIKTVQEKGINKQALTKALATTTPWTIMELHQSLVLSISSYLSKLTIKL